MTSTQIPAEKVDVDPASLLIDMNITESRTAEALDKDFVASIREYGVLMPIVAVRTAEGELRVRYGHKRTLAAVQAGRSSVPVVVVSTEENVDVIDRIVTQWHENELRSGLSVSVKADAAQQLALLGLSPTQIVKRTKAPKAVVAAALAVSGSDIAKGAARRYEFLTLDQAAGLAEFSVISTRRDARLPDARAAA